ncbi:MAG: glycosyltransferase family 2 protein [Tannerellaceae bacterium]|jgi:GT2 family glycosyltransferase|nr:glycosyltransferase family 2 protein [Tannerellaceae bacterium]
MSKNLFIIIATYNGMEWIEQSLNSVIKSDIPSTIVIVDNKSTDGTPAFVRKQYPQVKLFELNKNTGFGKANNIGIDYAITNGATYIYLLNQDAWVEPDTFSGLIRLLDDNPKYAIVSPIQYTGDGKNLDRNFPHLLSPKNCEHILNDLVVGHLRNDIYLTKFVMAAHWMVRTAALLKVGGFMPTFKHYGEDDNLIDRMLHLGWNVGITPLYKGYHDRENRQTSREQTVYMNFIRFLTRCMDVNKNVLWIPVWFILYSGKMILRLDAPLLLKISYIFKMFVYIFKCLIHRAIYKNGIISTFRSPYDK